MSEVFIYALCEPDDARTVRYVGRTIDPDARYIAHVSDVHKKAESHLPKARWIKKLMRSGKSPALEVLEIANEETWAFAERAWIAFFRANSTKELLNVADGGENIQPAVDHTGRVFGRLLVLHRASGSRFRCRCKCGTELEVEASSLVTRNTRSCGCLRRDTTRRRTRASHNPLCPGERFGRLVVVKKLRKRSGGHVMYAVKCDCGGSKEVAASDLRNGRVVSCKCFHKERLRELFTGKAPSER